MEFGPVPVDEAEGAILAHSIRAEGHKFAKGEALSAADLNALRSAGISEVIAARLGANDIGEDAAAAAVAAAFSGPGLSISAPFTGRVNVFAETAGIVRIDAPALHAVNRIHEAITVASLPDYARVAPRQMLATIKIIPYAAPQSAVDDAKAALVCPPITMHPPLMRRASVLLTKTPGMKESLITKGSAVIAARLAALGVEMLPPLVVAHETAALADALSALKGEAAGEITLILGASATSDREDVGPAAVVIAGGRIEQFGMPVDPGNLLFLGDINGRPVLGLPGCARSPKLNGVDWVLERLVCGISVGAEDIRLMGVGGLLKEIPSRPQPRAGAVVARRPSVSALLLGAGSSSRMHGSDKLMETVRGAPLLRHVAKQLLTSGADEVVVILRPDDTARRRALDGLAVKIVENPAADEGMGASIRAGMTTIAAEAEAALIALGDMPDITSDDINRMIAAYDAEEGREIIRAADAGGTPGNPVLFGRRFFEPLRALEGDEGARSILAAHADLVRLIAMDGARARTDLDTPEDWAAWRAEQED